MRSALAVAVALCAVPLRAQTLEGLAVRGGSAFQNAAAGGVDFSAVRAAAVKAAAETPQYADPAALGAPVATADLSSILDNPRRARTTFTLGGTTVRVFGGKSRNKKEWFVGFAPEGGEAQWFNGRRMIHWAFLNRTVRVEIAGRAFKAFVKGKLTDKMNSVLRVEPEDGSPAVQWTVRELSDAAYDAGFPVRFGGREYRLMYTRDFDQDGDGEFAGYAGDRSLSLMTRRGGTLVGYHWFEREIPADRVLLSTPKAVGADESGAGDLTLGLRRNGATLELYAPR